VLEIGDEPDDPDPVPVYGASLDEGDIEAVGAALRRRWLGLGRDVEDFERAVHGALGAPPDRHVVALSTGAAALHVAMVAAGVEAGTEVVLPSLCHLSDVQAVLAVGARPVFADVAADTMTLDPERVEELVTADTAAVLALDYGCHLCDGPALAALVRRHGLRLVRDAAHAFGSSSGGRPVGAEPGACVFSFDPVKCFTAVDAGLLVLDTEDERRGAQPVRLLGGDQPTSVMYANARTWDYDAVRIGYRYHLSNIHAALGVTQVAKLDRVRRHRQAACERYAERLKGLDPVLAPQADVEGLCPFLYYVRVPAPQRDRLRSALQAQGIATGLHWRPAHQHTYFQPFRRGPLPVTEAAADELVTLPLHSDMALATVDRVCDAIERYFR
jgi:dTDP-4-amino-4,6-dideoxygalactose transaminase